LSPTLNTLAPENVAHGSEILVQAQGPGSAAYITIAEIFQLQYDSDNMMERMPQLGTRRTAERRGRYDVKGTVKNYWLNAAARSMLLGASVPTSAGSLAIGYLSQVPFVRYNIIVVNSNWPGNVAQMPYFVFVNVTFGKDTVKWDANKYTEEDITFSAEDIYGQ
jgi:hypothetical protein